MIAKYHGKNVSLVYLREKCYIDREGVSMKGICEAAENIGMRSLAVKVALHDKNGEPSLAQAPLPAIIHWNQNHFVVLYKVLKSHVWIADPAKGKFKLTIDEFNKRYCSDKDFGVALLLEITPEFNKEFLQEDEGQSNRGISFLQNYVKPYYRLVIQLIIGLLLGTLFQLIFPFLTQSLVDIGIDNKNIDFIYLILFGQLFLFVSQIFVRFIQSWILLHISTRINLSLVSDFLVKLMKLPLGFFDSKNTGDLLQRIGDHNRIESFLTQSLLSFLLSTLSIIVFGIVLVTYSVNIFLIFLVASTLYVLWIFIFLKKRKEIDYRSFKQMSDNQESLIEIIHGMQEIKLQGSHLKRRWKWATIQARLFRTQMKSLAISQYQDAGALSSIHTYSIQYFDSLKNEKIILLDDVNFGESETYPIANQGDKIAIANGISYLEIRVEDSRADNVTNEYQTTIEYAYYNFESKPLPFTSRTGVVDNKSNIWLHPPRIGPLKILNLSAYPFVKFPIIMGDTWDCDMIIGRNWSHKDFGGLWKTDTDKFMHHYKVVGVSSLVINSQSFLCFQISSITKSKIGQSSCTFYFSEEFGFLRMSFFSLNGSEIRLTKSL